MTAHMEIMQVADEEDLLNQEIVDSEPRSRNTFPSRVFFAAIGAVALLGCVGVVVFGGRAKQEEARDIPLRSLLESDAFADTVARNLVSAGHVSESELGTARDRVSLHVQKVGSEIAADLPETHSALDIIRLTKRQQSATLTSLRLLGDQRVLAVGRAVDDAMHDVADSHGDVRENLKSAIHDKLQPHLEHMRQLRDTIFPRELRLNKDSEDDVDPERMHLVQTIDATESARQAGSSSQSQQQAQGAARQLSSNSLDDGIRDHVRILFSMMSDRFHVPLNVPMDASTRRLSYTICPSGRTGEACTAPGIPVGCNSECQPATSLFTCLASGGGVACFMQFCGSAFSTTFGKAFESFKAMFSPSGGGTVAPAEWGLTTTGFPSMKKSGIWR